MSRQVLIHVVYNIIYSEKKLFMSFGILPSGGLLHSSTGKEGHTSGCVWCEEHLVVVPA